MAIDSTTLGGGVDTWSLPDDNRRTACADDQGQDGSVFSTSERTQLFCTVERQRDEVKAATAAAVAAAEAAARGRLLKGDDDGGDTTEKCVTRRVPATAQQAAAAPPPLATAVSQEPGILFSGRRSGGGGGGGAGLCQRNCGTAPRPGSRATGVPESGKDDRIAAVMETNRLESCPLARVDVEGRLQVRANRYQGVGVPVVCEKMVTNISAS